jgi:hypothetical protein
MPREPHNYEAWWAEIPPWVTPKELREIRLEMGSAADILERHKRVERLLQNENRREWRWTFVKQVLGAIAVFAGTMLTFKALFPPEWWPW